MKIFTKKMLSVCLSLLILGNTFISPFTFVNAETQNNNDSSTYNEKNKNYEYVVLKENDFILKRDAKTEYLYIYLKDANISNERIDEIYKISSKYNTSAKNPAIIIGIIAIIVSIYNTQIYPYFELERTHKIKLQSTQDGWIDITKYEMTTWYHKTGGVFTEGWYRDSDYNGWYYFFPNKENSFMFDPKYSPSDWLLVNNKWYQFNRGGKLKEKEGWISYNGKWMFHLPKDFGALAGTCAKIEGKWYYFDRNGYMAYESYDKPDFSKLANSYN